MYAFTLGRDEVINYVDMSAKNKFSQEAKIEFILYVYV